MKQDEKWHLPEKFKVTANDRTPRMERLVLESNLQQAELAEKYATPFLSLSPKDKERARASILIKELEPIAPDELTDPQRNELAGAYAAVGLFGLASTVAASDHLKAEYEAIARALGIPDELWCDCGRDHSYAERDIFSIEANAYVSLMRCSKCGYRNAKDTPGHILAGRSRRQEIRKKYSGLHPLEAKAQMEADGVIKQ